ncbi:MAG: UDP-N-acetylmuramoyl-tripeptide--D-alanyl-D-alanine ligase [Burkholderiales bacterium]|nr:UDP-N-acetylmuramoyl-tripeptide--D-alanyl-D-alanine ligase [Burkholderiales bacterium]
MMTLQQATQWMAGARLVGDGALRVLRIHTDTRSVEPGDLFVALKGERYDANAFLSEAQVRGAVAVVCHAGLGTSHLPAGLPRIEVQDTKAALQALATAWRTQFDLPVIAVTGSNGKTTVTQMLASILDAQCPDDTFLATRGNLNNDIGVPLTLLRLRASHRMAVVELGMNHPGEIAVLAGMAQPTVALVNNAQREHLEFMQTVRAVAAENGSVIAALGAHGVAVIPEDDEFTALWQDLASPRRVVRFALDAHAADDVLTCAQAQWSHGGWRVLAQGLGVTLNYRLGIAGRYNVKNSLAAAACALAAGATPQAVELGLQNFVPVKGRSRAMEIAVQGSQRTVIDDTYNANPDSVRAAIDVLADLPGPRMLVLGDMGEVGHEGPAFHAEAGRYAHARGIEQLLAMGELTCSTTDVFPGAHHFDSVEDLNAAVLAGMPHVGSVLVKGSRFMRMERVVESVVAHFSNGEH